MNTRGQTPICNTCLTTIDFVQANSSCINCNDVTNAAVNAISIARQLGVPKYGPSSWREQTKEEHMTHAVMHMNLLARNDISEDHLSHAICRLAMARALDK